MSLQFVNLAGVREISATEIINNQKLNQRGCILVLFYYPNTLESTALLNLWSMLSNTLAGINFYAVDMSQRQFFNRPTILLYIDGTPRSYYLGERSFSAIRDFAISSACTFPTH